MKTFYIKTGCRFREAARDHSVWGCQQQYWMMHKPYLQGARSDGSNELVLLRDTLALLRGGLPCRRLHQPCEVNSMTAVWPLWDWGIKSCWPRLTTSTPRVRSIGISSQSYGQTVRFLRVPFSCDVRWCWGRRVPGTLKVDERTDNCLTVTGGGGPKVSKK